MPLIRREHFLDSMSQVSAFNCRRRPVVVLFGMEGCRGEVGGVVTASSAQSLASDATVLGRKDAIGLFPLSKPPMNSKRMAWIQRGRQHCRTVVHAQDIMVQ